MTPTKSDLHSKKIVLRNREAVLAQLLAEVAAERENIRRLKKLIKQMEQAHDQQNR
jgi:hypothetical protein